MEQEMHFIQEVFDVDIVEEQMDEKIERVLEWDSFMIMQMMAEVSNRYQYDISVMEIAEIESLGDLVDLISRIMH